MEVFIAFSWPVPCGKWQSWQMSLMPALPWPEDVNMVRLAAGAGLPLWQDRQKFWSSLAFRMWSFGLPCGRWQVRHDMSLPAPYGLSSYVSEVSGTGSFSVLHLKNVEWVICL